MMRPGVKEPEKQAKASDDYDELNARNGQNDSGLLPCLFAEPVILPGGAPDVRPRVIPTAFKTPGGPRRFEEGGPLIREGGHVANIVAAVDRPHRDAELGSTALLK